MSVAPNWAVWLSRISGGVPARDPDRLIKWFIGVVVIAVGVNLFSSFIGGAEVGLASAGCLCCGAVGRCAEYWSSAAGALSHNAGSGHGFARADRLSGGHGVGINDWLAARQ